ncbi:hypothetical protein T07_5502 [Trichinella nelsoni]|uniref:Transmembrane protein n=1 Tax=Trichinella nelsoni TaxID=6336 RepID=A0A0V0RLD6_9BILA|nr:hypothetical protein T07_2194 [Trichinella nelsoni]KRX15220.1 hypothetical protein T07_5502 [Trichinella nelsoni]
MASQSCTYFPNKLCLLFQMQISVPRQIGCHYDAFYSSTPNSVTHPQPLPSPPQSLSQSIFYKIAAANVALSCILGFPHSYVIGALIKF